MDEKTRNALSTLDLEPGSSLADVKKSYRELALIWHPDKVPDQVKGRATSKFTQINDAYQWLLRNPDRLNVRASYSGSSRRRPPRRPPSASGHADSGSARTQSSGSRAGNPGDPGDPGDPVVQRIQRAARGIWTDADAGVYIHPEIDADRAANFIVSLQQNASLRGVAGTVADLLVFYDMDGAGEEGMAITRSGHLINNNAGVLYDIGALVEVRLKERFFFWSEIVVRKRGRRTFESAGYAEKTPGKALAHILRNLVEGDP